jgi:hypothetical protein
MDLCPRNKQKINGNSVTVMADIGTCDAWSGSEYANASSANVRIRIPMDVFTTGTLVQATFLDLGDYPLWNPDGGALGYAIDLSADGFQKSFPEGKKVKLIIQYPDSDQDGFIDHTMTREGSLTIYSMQEKGGFDVLKETGIYPLSNVITCETGYFSTFILRGDPQSHITAWSLF